MKIPQEVLGLDYTSFNAWIKEFKGDLSDSDRRWLSDWYMSDLALSPMDDKDRAALRKVHYKQFQEGCDGR